MDTSQTSRAEFAEFLTSLEHLAEEPVSHLKLLDALQALDFTAAELKSIGEFTIVQLSRWRARWLFSSAQQPDSVAEVEDAGWQYVWETLSFALTEKAPDVAHSMRRMKDVSIAQALIQRKLEDDGASTLPRLWTSAAGGFAIALNRLGLRGIAEELYKRALCPRGSIGKSL